MALSRKPTNMVAEHCFAEQVELHDEMAEYMQRVSEQPAELSVEEQKGTDQGDRTAGYVLDGARRETGS